MKGMTQQTQRRLLCTAVLAMTTTVAAGQEDIYRQRPGWGTQDHGRGGVRTMELRSRDRCVPSPIARHEASVGAYSPDDIFSRVRQRVRYQPDMYRKEEWRSRTATWQQGAGDCEDCAVRVKNLKSK